MYILYWLRNVCGIYSFVAVSLLAVLLFAVSVMDVMVNFHWKDSPLIQGVKGVGRLSEQHISRGQPE